MSKYVIMSDLHIGAVDGLKADQFGRVVDELVGLGAVETLVLLGDVVELALAPQQHSLRLLRRFWNATGEQHADVRLCDIPESIVYVPGNHDHHIWTWHVEHSMIRDIKAGGYGDWDGCTEWAYVGRNSLLAGYLPDTCVYKLTVTYPTYSFGVSDGRVCVCHHGHQIYGIGARLLSTAEAVELSRHKQLRELELHNIGVYELLWYYLERSPVLRKRVADAWHTAGAFGAFGVVAAEIADSRLVDMLVSAGRLCVGPSDRGTLPEDILSELGAFLSIVGCGDGDVFVYGHSHEPSLQHGSEYGLPVYAVGNSGCLMGDTPTYIVVSGPDVELRGLGEGHLVRLRNQGQVE